MELGGHLLSQLFRRLRQEDQWSPGVQGEPGPDGETQSQRKKREKGREGEKKEEKVNTGISNLLYKRQLRMVCM
jgi:hypothetical protein